jgi:hypothetical protein
MEENIGNSIDLMSDSQIVIFSLNKIMYPFISERIGKDYELNGLPLRINLRKNK